MTKPTRGPWKVETYGSTTTLEIRSVMDGVPAIVNWTGFDDCHRKWGEHLANAKLMAASPDLLDACEGALEWLKHHGGDALPPDEPGMVQLIANLEAAIKKAK